LLRRASNGSPPTKKFFSCSTDGWVSRDGQGFLRHPEMLYRPWRVEEKGTQRADGVPRSCDERTRSFPLPGRHVLRNMPSTTSWGKLEGIGRATTGNAGKRPTLVSIILDGENCWEYYHRSGVDFLREFYRASSSIRKSTPTGIGEYVEKYPAGDKIGTLFAGSLDQHNFGIWLGHPDVQSCLGPGVRDAGASRRRGGRGWRAKDGRSISRGAPRAIHCRGKRLVLVVPATAIKALSRILFDQLFRKHLQNVYTILADPIPTELLHAIRGNASQPRMYSKPTSLP